MNSTATVAEMPTKTVTLDSYRERILRVLVHLQSRLDEPLSLDDLAGVACFSPFHFHRVFHAIVGESVKEHVRRLRLERAAGKLKMGAQSVTDVAFDAGYESHEAFTRAFRSMFNMAPSEYRESAGGFQFPEVPGDIDVTIKTLAPMRAVFIRHVGAYNGVGPAWSRLMAWVGRHGLFGPQCMTFGICYDDPLITPEDKLRYDACFVVNRPVEPEGEVGVQEIAGGDYATAIHKGPYELMGHTYAKMMGGWLPNSGRELRDAPCLEVYQNSPMTSRPEDLITVIHIPI